MIKKTGMDLIGKFIPVFLIFFFDRKLKAELQFLINSAFQMY